MISKNIKKISYKEAFENIKDFSNKSIVLDATSVIPRKYLHELLHRKGRLFFIYGHNAEKIHDEIDELFLSGLSEFDNIITIFFDQEDMKDKEAIFFTIKNFEPGFPIDDIVRM
jgi:hypothetical protein